MGNQGIQEIWTEPDRCPTCGKTCEYWNARSPSCRGEMWLVASEVDLIVFPGKKKNRSFHEEYCGRRIHWHRCTYHYHEEMKDGRS